MLHRLTASKVEALFRKTGTSLTADGGGLYLRKRTRSASLGHSPYEERCRVLFDHRSLPGGESR